MALTISRCGQGRISSVICTAVLRWQAAEYPRLKVWASGNTMQVATLKATYGEKYPYEKPFPYERKKVGIWDSVFERTSSRFNENSKIIVVEGNIAVGKTEFAKTLAKDFDLKFFPATSETRCFLYDDYNYDLRKLNELLPRSAQFYDLERFYAEKHPERGEVGKLVLRWYMEKFADYAAAMNHLLSTGQGVVMIKSVYSDSVFVDACRRLNWLTPSFEKYYYELRDNSICEFFKPHLTIYLDAPIDVLRKRINKRNDPKEVNSKILSDDYLRAIQGVYRDKFLPYMRKYGEVVEIDWTEVATDMDLEMIVEELQLLKLESEDKDATKFEDWSRNSEDDLFDMRCFAGDPDQYQVVLNKELPFECPEIMTHPDDLPGLERVREEHPLFNYEAGWAPAFGHRTYFKW